MYKHYTSLLAACLLSGISILSAQQTTAFKAKVIDDHSGQPLPSANIIIKGSLFGTNTNNNGIFSIDIDRDKDTLIISSIGYKTREVVPSGEQPEIRMIQAPYQLTPFNVEGISTGTVQRVQQNEMYVATDYNFYDEYILLLAERGRRKGPSLFLMDQDGKIISEKQLHIDAKSLFRDCMGNVHALTNDSAYQLYYDYRQLRLIYPFDKALFLATMEPCQVKYNKKLVTSFCSYRGLRKTYYQADNGVSSMFFNLAAEEKIGYMNRNFDLYYFLRLRNGTANIDMWRSAQGDWSGHFRQDYRYTSNTPHFQSVWRCDHCSDRTRFDIYPVLGPGFCNGTALTGYDMDLGYMTSVDGIIENLEHLQANMPLDWLESKITSPLRDKVFTIDGHLYIANLESKKVYEFDQDFMQQKEKLISLADENEWSRHLWVDEITNDIYTSCEINSKLYIIRLDKDHFSEVQRIPLNGKLFPDNIKIRGGRLYFLYSSPVEQVTSSLYSMQL